MDMFNYIAHHNPNGAKKLILSEGYAIPNSSAEGALILEQIFYNHRDGRFKVACIHPDRELLISSKPEVKALNASGFF